MTLKILGVMGLVGILSAQTFPAEFKTDDRTVNSAIASFVSRMTESPDFTAAAMRLSYLPASRVYRAMAAQARVAAVQQAMPLFKQIVMAPDLAKRHDEFIARQFGAVNHGLKLPPRGPDPQKRMKEMGEQMRKNPALAGNPKFMQEFAALQQNMFSAVQDSLFDARLTWFTRPVADVKGDVANLLEGARGSRSSAKVAQCYEAALPLAGGNPDRFRLQSFRCALMDQGIEKPEAEIDKLRKQAQQRLYDEKSLRGILRASLDSFLKLAASVDFNAQTAPRGSRVVFLNPAYEKQSPLWKLLYRNGKEPTAAAVQFCQQWLKEL